MTAKTKINFDKKADVLYVNLGTGEPSLSSEIEEWLIAEEGIYSGKITGYRILELHTLAATKAEFSRLLGKINVLLAVRAADKVRKFKKQEGAKAGLASSAFQRTLVREFDALQAA